MKTENFKFTAAANASGNIEHHKEVNAGVLKVTIKLLCIKTTSGCSGRKHQLHIRVNDREWKVALMDCHESEIRPDHGWRGKITLSVSADGFNPGESVSGIGTIEYSIGPFYNFESEAEEVAP